MQLEKLKEYIEESEQEILLRTPVAWHRKRGLVFLFLIPILAVLCGGLCGGGMYDEAGQGSEDALIIAVLVGIPVLIISIAGAIAGVVRLLRAGSLSEGSEVRIDLGRGLITSKTEGEVPLSQISGLELVQPSKLIQWRSIQAKVSSPAGDSNNPYQSSGVKTFTLLKDLTPAHALESVALMERLGERIGKPVYAAPEMTQPPQSNDRTAVTCHAPVQLIWLIFSLINLKNSNPLVRYHARLALLLGGMHVAVMLLLVLLMATIGAIAGDAGIAIGALLLVAGLFVMLGLRIVGMYKAWKKEYWQPPFFKSWTSSWLPEDPS